MKLWQVAVVVAIVIAVGYRFSEHGAMQRIADSRPKQVVVAPVKQTDFKVMLETVGTVVPKSTTDVLSPMDGQVAKILVQDGQMVSVGQPLVQLDNLQISSKINEIKAILTRDEAGLQKASGDLAKLEQQTMDDNTQSVMLNSLKSAQQAAQQLVAEDQDRLQQAQQKLAQTTIKAPVAGRMNAAKISQGSHVKAGATLVASISSMDPITVDFKLSQKFQQHAEDLLQHDAHDVSAEFNNDARVDRRDGTLSSVHIDPDTKSGMIELKADFANPQHDWLPGQFLKIKLASEELHHVLVVPSQALQQGEKGLELFLVRDGKAERVDVTELASNGGYSAIRAKALQAGDMVVVEGQYHLATQQNVSVKIQENNVLSAMND